MLTIGDRVLYRGSWGHHAPQTGTIVGAGIEAGETVFDVRLDDGRQKWGYAWQFKTLENEDA
jgi:hypothetical protein